MDKLTPNITFDPAKNKSNLAKHGIELSAASEILENHLSTTVDDRFDYGEKRFITAGYVGQRLHIAVWTQREGDIRVISVRKANNREVTHYEH